MSRKAAIFWPLFFVLVFADCSTKRLAEHHLGTPYVPKEVWGDLMRFTLMYNPGAAMGLSLGPFSRIWFSLLAVVAIALVLRLYIRAHRSDAPLAFGLALICGGAVGNLIDRLRSPLGVVDFIDVGIGTTRFWTFNIADVGVIAGASLLGVLLWRREVRAEFEAESRAGA